jgi:hypothetical protein
VNILVAVNAGEVRLQDNVVHIETCSIFVP